MQQYKVCFSIDEQTEARVKALPRSFNLSKRLRQALTNILAEMSDVR